MFNWESRYKGEDDSTGGGLAEQDERVEAPEDGKGEWDKELETRLSP